MWSSHTIDDDSAIKRNEALTHVTMGINSENVLSERSQPQKATCWDRPGGPVAKTLLPMQGVWVWTLIRELDPAHCNQDQRSCMPQL